MHISVVIPAHGRKELLVRCLKSLSSPTDFDYEVCVVDDGGGLDENLIRTESGVEYPLIWQSFESPRGRSAARNEGISSTTGDIIVFLDSDMEARKGFLDAHLQGHHNHPHTALAGNIVWPRDGSFLKYIGTRGVAKLKPGEPVPPWYFPTGNSSVERIDLGSDNPFDETLAGWGGEDLDLGMKLHKNGLGFTFASRAVSFHNFDGNLSSHIERTFFYGRDSLPVLTDRYPEILQITKLNLLDSAGWRFMITSIIFQPLLLFGCLFDRLPLPAALFDYLTFAAYARGWREREKK